MSSNLSKLGPERHLNAAFSFYSSDLLASSLILERSIALTATGILVSLCSPK
jgi:hypothetical protein